jgi:hypothetical protein
MSGHADQREDSTGLSLSRSLVVAITSDGLQVPARSDHPARPLHRADLEVLQGLATGDAPADDPSGLAGDLLDRRLLDRSPGWPLEPAPTAALVAATARPLDGDAQFVTRSPVLLRPGPAGFDLLDHDGSIALRLDTDTLLVAVAFCTPSSVTAARASLLADPDTASISPEGFEQAVQALATAGLLAPFDFESSPQGREDRELQSARETMIAFNGAMREVLAVGAAAEADRVAAGNASRTKVLPVLAQPGMTPLALGMLFAAAKAHRGGALQETFDFVPHWWLQPGDIVNYGSEPAIYLFSNYVWSVRPHLSLCDDVKAANPANLTIHGGPDTPRNAADVERFFRANPTVDIAVHGEGEVTTTELFDALATSRRADGSFDLSVLADVPGLSFRLGEQVVRSPDRDRVAELDLLPSPYLTGIFDGGFSGGRTSAAIIETNRGCPYGCTFCDWGSATLSRIRKFDLERVFAELEWCARNQVPTVVLADANFGIFERDVEIAQHFAALKQEYGYPFNFGTNYAKNTVKHLKQIVQTLVQADVLTEGLLSLQTMDADTLATVKRSNIKTEKYDLLANEFRTAGLPLFIDLMLGLPGSTTSSFRGDLQQCMDREVTPKIFQTEVLVNSPMNQPEYMAENEIVTAFAGEGHLSSKVVETSSSNRRLIVSTASFTRDDYDEMLDLRRLFRLVDNFGVLRQITRYARQETGRREIDIIDQLRNDARDTERWPMLALTFQLVPELMVPPMSWAPMIDEVGTYLVDVLGVARDASLDTVLRVQHALLPAPDRTFPLTLDLAHDFGAWHRAMIEAKDAGHTQDWYRHVPHLRELPAATFVVEDPVGVCRLGLGFSNEADWGGDWELESPVARAMPNRHRLYV